jgi:hypothetical protein
MIRVGDKVRHLIIVFRRLVKRQMPADMTMNQKYVETP